MGYFARVPSNRIKLVAIVVIAFVMIGAVGTCAGNRASEPDTGGLSSYGVGQPPAR